MIKNSLKVLWLVVGEYICGVTFGEHYSLFSLVLIWDNLMQVLSRGPQECLYWFLLCVVTLDAPDTLKALVAVLLAVI